MEPQMQTPTIDVTTMPDEMLAEAASLQRRAASRGDTRAFGHAHELERELRRRAGVPCMLGTPPVSTSAVSGSRPWWLRWGRQTVQ